MLGKFEAVDLTFLCYGRCYNTLRVCACSFLDWVPRTLQLYYVCLMIVLFGYRESLVWSRIVCNAIISSWRMYFGTIIECKGGIFFEMKQMHSVIVSVHCFWTRNLTSFWKNLGLISHNTYRFRIRKRKKSDDRVCVCFIWNVTTTFDQ